MVYHTEIANRQSVSGGSFRTNNQQRGDNLVEEQSYYNIQHPVSRLTPSGDRYPTEPGIYSKVNGDYDRTIIMDSKPQNGYSTIGNLASSEQDRFSCFRCGGNLSGSRYILKDDQPCCIECYENHFAHTCERCSRKIGTESRDLSYKERHWHEKCFFCAACNTPLVDKPFGCKKDILYCGECYNQQFASRCDKCNQIFKPGSKKLEYHGQQFHEYCFTCFGCSQPIGTKSFIPKEQRPYCVPCYEDHFGTKCTLCSKVIDKGGVTYKNQPWHRECFKCTNCPNSLAGQRFTSRDNRPYCNDCFARLFAKKCFACDKAITGPGGTRYISFENRHWHSDCFACNRCRSSLVGRGFLTEGEDILCSDCCKREQNYQIDNTAYVNEPQHTYMNGN